MMERRRIFDIKILRVEKWDFISTNMSITVISLNKLKKPENDN